jgi:subtilisin family serine protease
MFVRVPILPCKPSRCLPGGLLMVAAIVCSASPIESHMTPTAEGPTGPPPVAGPPIRPPVPGLDRCREQNPAGNVVVNIPCFGRASAPGINYVPGELLVKFKRGVTAEARIRNHNKADAVVLSEIKGLQVDRVRSRRGESTESLRERYRNDPDVEYAEPNLIVRAQALPNDPLLWNLWGLNNTGQSGGQAGADISAFSAWDLQTGSNSVLVADIDSGVDRTHPDLAANIWTNPGEIPGNGKDDDGNGYIDDVHGWNFIGNDNNPADDYGHGTHTAGILGAVGNNGVGVVGVAWRTKIMPVKFIGVDGTGTIADAASAVLYAVQMGAKISSNSWGCLGADCFSQTFQDALTTAGQQGMLFVAAAGNDGSNNDGLPFYPCDYALPNVVCVAATDQSDNRAVFSNYGASTVDLGAPGVSVLSTVPAGSCALCDPSGYRRLDGTSMATPYVAGVAALALSQFPTLTTAELKTVILGSVDPIPALATITTTGGRLNADRAVRSNFLIDVDPSDLAVPAGGSITTSVTLTSLTGVSDPVALSVSTSDPAITGSLSATAVMPPPLGSASVTLTIDAAMGITEGTYRVMIDGVSDHGEVHAVGALLTVQTNLSMDEISGPPTGETGKWITVTSTVSNPGTADANGFYVGVYLSTDPTITTADLRIGSRWISSLHAGARDSAATVVWLPTSLASGAYYLGAIADDLHAIPDSRESDNALSGDLMTIGSGTFTPPVWVARYHGPGTNWDQAEHIARDSVGNIYVAGYQQIGQSSDDVIVKYDMTGHQIWAIPYDGGGYDILMNLAVDSSGNIYVVGESQEGVSGLFSFVLFKYSADGVFLWQRAYDSGSSSIDLTLSLAIDASDDVYLSSQTAILKYDASGNRLWAKSYQWGSMIGSVYALQVDGTGNVYVGGAGCPSISGCSQPPYMDMATAKYDRNGNELWIKSYDGGGADAAWTLSIDQSGSVYAMGSAFDATGGGNADMITVKYDSDGTEQWAARYDNGGADLAESGMVDAFGNLYVSGQSGDGMRQGFVTVKYDADGRQLWASRYDNGIYEEAPTLTVDPFGNVYVTGGSGESGYTSNGWTYFSPDYVALIYGPGGNPLWVSRYGSDGVGDYSTSILVDELGAVYVTGSSYDPNTANVDMATVKYDSPLARMALSVTTLGDGDGIVTSVPAAINCGPVCQFNFIEGSAVTLIATPVGRSVFSGWSGDADCSDGMVTMTTDVACTATFTAVPDRPPILGPIGDKTITEYQPLMFTVSASDPDGDLLTFSAAGLPAGATFDPATQTFSWTPAFAQSGSYQIAFMVSDGDLTDSTMMTITVTDAPLCTGTGVYELRGAVAARNREERTGVTLTLTGPDGCAAETTTDRRGHYSFTTLGGGDYTVTPSKQGDTFTPTLRVNTLPGRRRNAVNGVDFKVAPTP